jgi:uncharacterized phage protein (TIGR02220 family)
MDKDENTYTIIELAKNHKLPYMALYKYLVSVGLKHLCFCPVRWNAHSLKAMEDMQDTYTVVEISRYMKANGLKPDSRQTINQYMIDNNIVPVTKYSRRIKEMKKEYETMFGKIMADINMVSRTNYQLTDTNRKRVFRWLEKGYTVDDFKRVHRHKHKEWLGTENEKYLQPSTLYRPCHFEDYLDASKNVNLNKKGVYIEEENDGIDF